MKTACAFFLCLLVLSCGATSADDPVLDLVDEVQLDQQAGFDFVPFDGGVDSAQDVAADAAADGTGVSGDAVDVVAELTLTDIPAEVFVHEAKWVVMTMNLHCHLQEPDKRMALIAEEALARGVDVLALQEVCEGDNLENTADTMLGYLNADGEQYTAITEDVHIAWDVYQEGIALIFKGTLQDYAVLALPPGKFERELMWARIDAPQGTLDVAVTHLSFGADQAQVRLQQATAVRNWLNSQVLPDAPGPVILAGDFNCAPNAEPMELLFKSGWNSSWLAVGTGSAGHSYPAPNPNKKIDYILGFGGSYGGWSSAEMVFDKAVDGLWASDHRGIVSGLY